MGRRMIEMAHETKPGKTPIDPQGGETMPRHLMAPEAFYGCAGQQEIYYPLQWLMIENDLPTHGDMRLYGDYPGDDQ